MHESWFRRIAGRIFGSPPPDADLPRPDGAESRMMSDALERIESKLRRAVAMDARPFGAETSGLHRAPPLSPEAVTAVEARLGVALPEEYRAFITRIGDGGAGPAYGLFSLDEAVGEAELGVVPDLVALPFPHAAHYNPGKDDAVLELWNRVDAGEVNEADADAFDARLRAGTLALCDEGCGYLHFLVVSGPARGTMWIDSRASDAGFGPLGVTFLEWYERWLDDVLAGGHGTWWLGPPVYPPQAKG